MNQRIPTDLRNILATLYPDERSIRRVVDDAGVDSSKMVIDAHAQNSWHSVLSEAEKIHQVEALLKAVEVEYGSNQAFQSIYHAYRQAASGFIGNDLETRVNHPKIQGKPQRQWLFAAMIGLLLIAIISVGWYWGIPGLRNPSIAISSDDTTTVPDTDRTEVPQAGTPSMASAAPSPSNNTTNVTQTQVSIMTFTLTPELSTNTPTATSIATPPASSTPTPTVTFTPTPQPMATTTPTPGPTYPCTTSIVTNSVAFKRLIYHKPEKKPSLLHETLIAEGTTATILNKSEDELWYKVQVGNSVGWIQSEYLPNADSCLQ